MDWFCYELENELPNDMNLISENKKLRERIEKLEKLVMNEKMIKEMKEHIIDISSILKSIEELVKQDRGLIRRGQTFFEFTHNFLDEVNSLADPRITIRDLAKLQKQAKQIHELLIIPKE